ncbi:MAG TPA: hypothetical protein VFX42_05765 [Gemmatimonadales bacterium]|nr:hypothetical protein [Gemmatimonadales bacterium]
MRFGLALLLGGPVLGGSLTAQTAPTLPVAEFQPVTSCSIAIVPTRECFRHSDLLIHRRHASARAPDHRYEGLAIGAGLGAVGGVLLGLAVCGQSEDPDTSSTGCAIGGGLGGAVLGGFVGLLVGAQFPKEEAAPRDSVPS